MTENYIRSDSELFSRLQEQVAFLRTSTFLFDSGLEYESQRIALALRVLLHDTKKQTSLLKNLQCKDSIQFIDTGIYPEDVAAAQKQFLVQRNLENYAMAQASGDTGLAIVVNDRDGYPRYAAPLGYQRKLMGTISLAPQNRLHHFEEWWKTKFIKDAKFNTMCRADLILTVAEKDGGAHVDKSVERGYAQFCVEGWGGQFAPGVDLTQHDDPGAWSNYSGTVVAASIRQIAYEVLLTLENKFGEQIHISALPDLCASQNTE